MVSYFMLENFSASWWNFYGPDNSIFKREPAQYKWYSLSWKFTHVCSMCPHDTWQGGEEAGVARFHFRVGLISSTCVVKQLVSVACSNQGSRICTSFKVQYFSWVANWFTASSDKYTSNKITNTKHTVNRPVSFTRLVTAAVNDHLILSALHRGRLRLGSAQIEFTFKDQQQTMDVN